MTAKKIVLINPPWVFAHPRDIVLSQNLGLGYLASSVMAQGHRVSVIDALAEGVATQVRVRGRYQPYVQVGLAYAEIVTRIPRDADYIGITAPFTNHARIVKELAQKIKESFPRVPIILGGVYPSLVPAAAFCAAIDYYVIGEGELPLVKLLDGAAADSVLGLLRCGQTERIGECAETIKDLDHIPFPAREKFPLALYLTYHSPRKQRLRTASVITSRGCPFGCRFCSIHAVTGFRWRKRSAENVLREIAALVEEHQVEHIEFEDDNFTLDKQRTIAIVDGISRLNATGKNISWSIPNGVRIDTLDEDLLLHIRQSNCIDLALAVESGDQNILAKMNKQLDLQKVLEVAKICARLGIKTSAFFMLGYPGETEASFRKSIAFVKQLRRAGVHNFYATVTRAYPGTELFQQCRVAGFLEEIADRENIFLGNFISRESSIVTPEFSSRDVLRRMSVFEKITVPWYLRWYHTYHHSIKKIIPDVFIQAMKRIFFKRNAWFSSREDRN